MSSTNTDDGPEVNPNVYFLYDLLKWVRQGRVRVPAFQRSFVWSRTAMLELFESVRKRYPIGTLLFWRSPSNDGRSAARLGPFNLAGTTPTDHILMLLDGQQRLTTLAGVLLQNSGLPLLEDEGEDNDRWSVLFDSNEGPDGTFIHSSASAKPDPWQVALHELADSSKMFDALDRVYKISDEDPLSLRMKVRKDVLIRRLQSVARALQSYKIPVVEFVTDNLTLAVESFTLLNKKGVAIGADEMFSALTYIAGKQGDTFSMAREISSTLESVKHTGFGELERVLVLRTFLLACDLDPYRTDWNKLGEETRADATERLPAAMERARAGLLRGIDFLREERILNARMLPYGLQLVGLACWLGENASPSEAARRLLRRWLWLSGFSSWFGQGNPSRYTQVLVELRDAARGVEAGAPVPPELSTMPWSTPAEPFPARYDLRSARVRTLLCLLAREGVLQPDGKKKGLDGIAADFALKGPEAMRTIWVRCSDPELKVSPANRIFDVFGGEQGQARGLLKKVATDQLDAFLASHHLTGPLGPALEASASGGTALVEILRIRLRTMMDLERRFIADLELRPPLSPEPAQSPIDQDDDAPLPVSDNRI